MPLYPPGGVVTLGTAQTITADKTLAAGVNLIIGTGSLQVGTTPATAGSIRLPNAGTIQARKADNSSDRQVIAFTSFNQVSLGGSGDVIITSNDIRPASGGAGLYDIGAAGTEWRTIYGRNLDLSSDAALRSIVTGTVFGATLAATTAQKTGMHGASVIQRAGAAQAAAAATAATNVTPFGYSTAAQADAIVTLVNEIRAALVEKGIIKGSA